MIDEQLEKAERLRKEYNFENVSFHKSYIEHLFFDDASFDFNDDARPRHVHAGG